MKETTRILHEGDTPELYHGAVNPPVVHASLFGFKTYQEFIEANESRTDTPFYNRYFNPTTDALERKVADLERAEMAIAFSSGMAAITAPLLALLSHGDHLLVIECVYGPMRKFCEDTLTRMGIEIEFFPSSESADLSGRIKENTRLIYLESPGSLTFDIQDIAAVVRVAKAHNIDTILDNSWATPLYQKPIEMGIDVVVHSGTKYIAGHSDLTLGLLACSREYFDKIKPTAAILGASLAPDDAYLALRGLRTLPLRMAQHQESALKIAHWLQTRPEVREVLHPGLSDFSQYDLAQKQMTGYSSLFSFRLQPGTQEARVAFLDTLELFLIGVSWGGYESLVIPLSDSQKARPDLRQRLNLDDDTFRTSIGLEDTDDLIADLEQGLAAWRAVMD